MKHHRTTHVDGQFLELLRQLRADRDLLERFVSTSSSGDRKALMSQLTAFRRELATHDSRRRAIFEAYESQALTKEELSWRLQDLRSSESAIAAKASEIEDQLAIEKARRISIESAVSLVARAADIWSSAEIDDKRAIAKAVAAAVGKMVGNGARKLTPFRRSGTDPHWGQF
jgi:hypothetical protein